MNDRHADDWLPIDDAEHARQIAALRTLVRESAVTRALDLGCGDGRIAIEAARDGVRVLGVDRDTAAILALRSRDAGVEAVVADALSPQTSFRFGDGLAPQCAWCLGNTFMHFHDVHAAAALMRRLRETLDRPGWFAIDNFVVDVWRDVAEGNWQEGVSDDADWQMVWASGDEAVALRRGDAVDPDDWEFRERDSALRLWSLGSLRLLALSSGWRGPEADPTGALLVFRPD